MTDSGLLVLALVSLRTWDLKFPSKNCPDLHSRRIDSCCFTSKHLSLFVWNTQRLLDWHWFVNFLGCKDFHWRPDRWSQPSLRKGKCLVWRGRQALAGFLLYGRGW